MNLFFSSIFSNKLLLFVFLMIFSVAEGVAAPSSPVAAPPAANDGFKISPPKAPFVRGAPNPGAWSLAYSYPEERTPVEKKTEGVKKVVANKSADVPQSFPISISGRIQSVSITRSGRVIHAEVSRVKEDSLEIWKDGAGEYSRIGESSDWIKRLDMAAPDVLDQIEAFPNVDWLSADFYLGTMMYKGQKCDVFIKDLPPKTKVADLKEADKIIAKSDVVVFVDSSSHFPVEERSKGIYIQFSMGLAPGELACPSDLTDQLQESTKVHDTLSQRGLRPY